MRVTFVANSRVLGYKPGQIVKAELTDILHAVLTVGRHLTLIDPPTVAQLKVKPDTVVQAPVTPREESENGESTNKSEAVSSSIPKRSTSRTGETS